jgi:hypothetical protein
MRLVEEIFLGVVESGVGGGGLMEGDGAALAFRREYLWKAFESRLGGVQGASQWRLVDLAKH